MSVDYGAKIMVGLPRGKMIDEMDEEKYGDVNVLIYEEDLECCSLWYDGDGDDDAIVGFAYLSSGDFCARVLDYDLDKVYKLKKKFNEVTGLNAQVYLCTHGH